MTADEFREAMYELGWSNSYLAELLGVRLRAVDYYRSGRNMIPPQIAAWVRLRVALHRANPPPPKPDRHVHPPHAEAGPD